MKSTSTIRQKALLTVFFLSGFSALMYQVVWQRWLVFYTGIGSLSISLIVSAFMAGLGLGYLAGGIMADRAVKNKPILYFVFAELGIGLFALFSKNIIYDFLYHSEMLRTSGIVQTYLILFLVLVFPTFLMGLSLPLLSKAFQLKDLKNQSQFISKLYFVNTLGAGIGAFLTGLLFIRLVGLHHSVYIGASFNFLCAIIAGLIYQNENNEQKAIKSLVKPKPFQWNKGFSFWATQYAMSGFMAICFEIIWFRILDVTIKSISMTFAIVLFIYLISMAFGTNYGVKFLQKPRQNLLAIFLKVQYFMYFYSVGIILLLLLAVSNLNSLSFLSEYFYSYETSFQPKIILITYAIIPPILMSIPTFLMGFSFAISQSIIQDDYTEVGRKVGWLQFINIVGSSIGAWFVTLVGFNILGTSFIIKLLGIIGVVYIILMYKRKILSIAQSLYLSVVLLAVIYFIPNHAKFWQILAGVKDAKQIIMTEDDTALSSIKMNPEGAINDVVFVNGLGQSHLPFNADDVHITLGSVPSLLHPNPEDIAIIGLGSGGTLYNVSGRPETKQIDCFEVIKSQPDVLRTYSKQRNDQNVVDILEDKRVNLILKDGRFEIQNNDKKYDIIEADALRPRSSYSGNIYSKEYFEVLSNKLKKGGIVATWMPTNRVKDTFVGVFPYVYEIGGFLLIGSNQSFTPKAEMIAERLSNHFTKTHFQKANIDVQNAVNQYISKIETIQNGKTESREDINTDMFPKDEYLQGDFKKILGKLK
ncbi:MAG: fused MFS/spermidine synthase [Arcicella sp.]|nr:fused MFS/spermidine synthase [Arcicella sp.]